MKTTWSWWGRHEIWISSDMMMNTKYNDENDVVVVRTPWNLDIFWHDDEHEIQWWKRRGRGEDAMKSGSCWGPHEIAFANVTIFAASFATRVLRVYYVYGDVTTLGSRPSRPHRVLTAFQVRSPNLGDHGDHSTMSDVSTTFIPRLYHACGDLGALWTHFPSP